MKFFFLSFILIFFNCSSYNQIDIKEKDYEILKVIMNIENLKIRETAFLNKNIKSAFGIYNKWYLAEMKTKGSGILLNGKVEWIFNDDDINYMKKKHKNWKFRIWKNIDNKNLGKDIVTYPLYNKNHTKAMVFVLKANISYELFLLKNTNNKWIIVGKLLSGIVH